MTSKEDIYFPYKTFVSNICQQEFFFQEYKGMEQIYLS